MGSYHYCHPIIIIITVTIPIILVLLSFPPSSSSSSLSSSSPSSSSSFSSELHLWTIYPCSGPVLCAITDSNNRPEKLTWSYFTTGAGGSEKLRWVSSQSPSGWSQHLSKTSSSCCINVPRLCSNWNLLNCAFVPPTPQYTLTDFYKQTALLSKN